MSSERFSFVRSCEERGATPTGQVFAEDSVLVKFCLHDDDRRTNSWRGGRGRRRGTGVMKLEIREISHLLRPIPILRGVSAMVNPSQLSSVGNDKIH